ncbi:unnamed protein product [Dovyalis caffra]|uniref:Uncharacterized protein n=1 Tax=Dovyalis caffra TaxID=77055 RepID=A0AAV1QVH8_9ROSI|nr:unnamed protein product [Dovyalis caffra]
MKAYAIKGTDDFEAGDNEVGESEMVDLLCLVMVREEDEGDSSSDEVGSQFGGGGGAAVDVVREVCDSSLTTD